MTTIYLIRHAEAEGNVFRRLQGQYDSLITPNGRKQIAALEQRFANIHVDAVYASDLSRTCITAGAIYKPKGLPLHKDRRLREIAVGAWENQPFGWLDHIDPVNNRAFSQSPKTWSIEGSETFDVYTGRFLTALREIAQKHDGQTVALFSHGMVLRGSLQTLFFPDQDNAIPHCENTAVSCLYYENGDFRMEYLNDASHITPEISTLGRQMWWRGGKNRDFNMWYRDPEEADAPLLHALQCPKGKLRISMLDGSATGAVVIRDGVLLHFALLPEFRGRGLSAQLLGEAINLCRKEGHKLLTVDREPEHPAALHVLEQYGFVGKPRSLSVFPIID